MHIQGDHVALSSLLPFYRPRPRLGPSALVDCFQVKNTKKKLTSSGPGRVISGRVRVESGPSQSHPGSDTGSGRDAHGRPAKNIQGSRDHPPTKTHPPPQKIFEKSRPPLAVSSCLSLSNCLSLTTLSKSQSGYELPLGEYRS